MAKPVKRTAPAAAKKTTAAKTEAKANDIVSVVSVFTADGQLNTTQTDVVETVALPEGALISRVSVTQGLAAAYGELKASVAVTVPCVLGEEANAGKYAQEKAMAILDEVGAHVAEAREASGNDADEDGDDAEGEEADDEDGDDGDDEEGITAEDVRAMNRKQIEAFLAEYAEDCEEAGEDNMFEDIDLDDYKKTKGDLTKLQDAICELLEEGDDEDGEDADDEEADDEDGDDGYTEAELKELSTKELKEIYKEWELGKYPKTDAIARKKILEAQDEGDDE